MATRGRYTTILLDSVNLDGQSNNVEIQIQNGVIDVTPFQSDGRQYLVEPPQGSIRHNGYLSTVASPGLEARLYGRLGVASGVLAVLLGTDTAACPTYLMPAVQSDSLQISAPVSNVITIQGNWIASAEALRRGIRILGATISATGAQTHVDLGVAGVDGYAYLFVTAISGTASNATITVQSDDNTGFSGATTHGTFTFSLGGGYAMDITGAIGRYVRANVTSLGGATSFAVTAVIVSLGATQAVA